MCFAIVKVELEQELTTDATGLCGKHNIPGITMTGMDLDCCTVAALTLTAVPLAPVTVLLVGKVHKLLFSDKV